MAYLFAQIIAVFNFVGDPDRMQAEGNHWALMWVIFAVAIGASYFFLGWITTRVAYVGCSFSPVHKNGEVPPASFVRKSNLGIVRLRRL